MHRPTRRTALAWVPVALLGVAALLRLAGADRVLPVAPLMAVTPYLALASLAAIAFAAALRRADAVAGAAIVFVAFAAVLVPRAVPGGQGEEPPGGRALTVMTVNLHLGRADPETIVELV